MKLAAVQNYVLVFIYMLHKKVRRMAECLPRKSKLVKCKSSKGKRNGLQSTVDLAIVAGKLFVREHADLYNEAH